ncbi:MAG: hypothetical protein RLZZ584_3660 [Pseudomonadota bacterium]
MQPVDIQALEDAAWQDFVRRLGEHLAAQWPAMPERLGERYGAFIDLAVQQALQRGLTQAASVARFVNLWFVWGPAYHDKPGYQWAQDILALPGAHEWLRVHQLVQRSMVELARMPGSRIEPAVLDAADERACLTFGPLGARGAMVRLPDEPPARPRKACDLEGAEIRLLEDNAAQPQLLQRYDWVDGAWQRQPVAPPAPLRIVAGQRCPPLVSVLSPQSSQGPATRLALRVRAHAVCNGDVHPAFGFAGPHGRWTWAGHETRALNWPAVTRDQPPPPAGAGTLLAEETSPELHKLDIETCALRDEGDALGVQQAVLSAWPAEQWLLDLVRTPAELQTLTPGGRPVQRGSTRCRLERDGQPQDALGLTQQFDLGLEAAVAEGLNRLVEAWATLGGLDAPRCEARLALLSGRAACTWGWQAPALEAPAYMRVVAALDLLAGQAALEFAGVWALRGSRSRISLKVDGRAELRQTLRREAARSALVATLMPAVARWRWPFTLELEPQAGESLALLQQEAPLAGALVGEAGLRPGTHGRSGWEWYARLGTEPVLARVRVEDPLLGRSSSTHTLLPALTVVDWSMG